MTEATKKKRGFLEFLAASRIKSANVHSKEMILGYLVGPFGALITNAVFTSFLNRFYTDVLGMVGRFITLLPLFSTLFVIIGNLVMGVIIDKTKSRFGKARPYLLVSAPLVALSVILIFAVPTGNDILKIVWIAVTYNLYFAIAYPIYFMAHSMMIPLSTRNMNQRGTLSVVSNASTMGAAGLFAAMIFPMLLYPQLKNQADWLTCMSIIGAVALVAILLEFSFTRERITEESQQLNIEVEKIPISRQLKGVVTDKYWWIIILFYLLFNFSGGLKNLSMSYYCDYVVGKYQDGITQTALAAMSGIPMALGVVVAWPLANKFGKKNITIAGILISVLGGIISLIAPDNFWLVVIGVTIKTFGTIPACYVMMALFADVLDHLEAKNGFRCDGLSMSLYSVITVAALGVITSVFNGLISVSGYQAPSIIKGVTVAAQQNEATKLIFIISFLGVETVAYAIIAVMLNFLKVEKNIKQEQEFILTRQKEAVLAAGGTWVDPAERARLEQEKYEVEAEKARRKELQEKCRRKGLSFEAEEDKYQRKLAEKKAK